MPHMANLNWILAFSLFNLMLVVIMFSLNFSSVKMPLKNYQTINNNKKWQW